jgi:trk system potassium uptake protein TrkH
VFHAVSAFCNAGFALFSNSFEGFTSNVGINCILALLIITGGIGFLILNELSLFFGGKIKSIKKFSVHTRLVIMTSLLLIVIGFLILFIEESFNLHQSAGWATRALYSLFQSITARTAGFNTIPIAQLSMPSILVIMILMFIGASPGSTGGGIKTSSVGLVFAYLKSRLQGREQVSLFYRTISPKNIEKSFMIIIVSIMIVVIGAILLLSIEDGFRMDELLFETISAFATVGLSFGITPQLGSAAKFILIIIMFIGRIGPLTLFVVLSRKESKANFNYPEESIMIG